MNEYAGSSAFTSVTEKLKTQFAVLPWRLDVDGELQFLLMSSRETRRWVIPKGWPMKGLAPGMAVQREAYEEAGVEGYAAIRPAGTFRYMKRRRSGREVLVEVEVYGLQVTIEHDEWPEMHEREKLWTSRERAEVLVDEPGLKALISAFTTR